MTPVIESLGNLAKLGTGSPFNGFSEGNRFVGLGVACVVGAAVAIGLATVSIAKLGMNKDGSVQKRALIEGFGSFSDFSGWRGKSK